ncbi:Ubiquitin--protein ligase [Bertholletia excelsa]
MAMSLEEFLVEEGFRGRRSKTMARTSFRSEAARPLHSYGDHYEFGSSSRVKKTERTKSDVSPYNLTDDFLINNGTKGRRPRDNLVTRKKLDKASKEQITEKFARVQNDLYDISRDSVDFSKDFPHTEIVEVGVRAGGRYKDIHLNKTYSPVKSKYEYSDGLEERERYKRRSEKGIEADSGHCNDSNNNLLEEIISSDTYWKGMKQPRASNSRSNKSSKNKKGFDGSRSQKYGEIEMGIPQPPLDKVAIRAIISILNGCIKNFLEDEDFYTALHQNCLAMLNFAESEEGVTTENKIIANFKQAIGTVERAVMECASAKELKRASLQLSVITGLNSDDLIDGFTSGIPNSKLSACAHLYLSVIYKLQKKDRIAAKHLLQVFCDLPFQARTVLLPDLWDSIFFPHLSDLTLWYNQEADSLADAPSKARKLKLLDKVYNEIMDSGTYQFAVYYKDWLTEGVEAPSIPQIHIPSVSVQQAQQESQGVHLEGAFSHPLDVESPTGPLSHQPMVSKRLYDSVFGRSDKPEADEVEDYKGTENIDTSTRGSDGPAFEDKQALTCNSTIVNYVDQDTEQNNASYPEDGRTAGEACRVQKASAPGEEDAIDLFHNPNLYREIPENSQVVHAIPLTKTNELTLRRLADSVFKLPQTEESLNLAASTSSSHVVDAPYPDSFANVPQDFICPLTGLLFEDPVTLETGQTFERAALTEWFKQVDKTCPVTGKALECQSVPLSNVILKRVVNSWRSERSRHLLVLASQIAGECKYNKVKYERAVIILEQLLTAFIVEERILNAKLLISLGGLQFLLWRFESGNLEEKTRVVTLLSSCVEADTGCRNYIAKNIKKPCLLELIHSNHFKSRENAVLLLVELICLHRRKDVNLFLNGLQNNRLLDTMHVLLAYLRSSPLEQRPLAAVVLLHLDLLVEPQSYSIYREEAVDSITAALESSLSNEKIRTKCCRALLILGGRFSSSGKIMTEDWILRQTGFLDGPEPQYCENQDDDVLLEENNPSDDEEETREEWLRSLSASLIGGGKKSFLESISKCLGSGSMDLVRVCLTTVAWLSSALISVADAEFQLSAFSALIPQMKDRLENGERIEHRILASTSLLHFSKIPECRVLLMQIAGDIAVPLKSLAEVTWTAKELNAIISEEVS